MASIRTKFTVGLFVTIGTIIAVSAVIWFGMSHYFEDGTYYLAYFDESVQGLDKDSPVKYRGVSIGRVESVSVAPDATLVETLLKIDTGLKPENNMCAQLKAVGITGMMYVELNRREAGEKDRSPEINFPTDHTVIPTKPSDIKMLFKGLDDIFAQVNKLDMQGISDGIIAALDDFSTAVADADIKTLSAGVRRSLVRLENILDEKKWDAAIGSIDSAANSIDTAATDFDTLSRDINRLVTDNENDLRSAIIEFREALETAGELVSLGNQLLNNTDATVDSAGRHLIVTLRNIERASDHLSRTLERLSDNPSQLILGDPPAERELP